ncbi:hypothetical protein AAFF_G00115670, partial [Aldrovandia affinis]
MGSSRKDPRNQRGERRTEDMERLGEEGSLSDYMGKEEGRGAEEAPPQNPADHQSKLSIPSMEPRPLHDASSSERISSEQKAQNKCVESTPVSVMTECKSPTLYEEPATSSIHDLPVPNRTERRRKMGSTRKSPHRPKMQTERARSLSTPDVLYNVVLVGDSSVGKTSFMKRFQSAEFSMDHSATI